MGGATAVARQLPDAGSELLIVARHAFTRSLEKTVAGVSAALAIASAVTVIVWLRRVDELRPERTPS